MGIVGRFIDGLNDEQGDRLVRAQRWMTHGYEHEGKRCLVGHAIDYSRERPLFATLRAEGFGPVGHGAIPVFDRFDRLVARFGLPRVVRAIKLRAGATVEELAEPEPEPVS